MLTIREVANIETVEEFVKDAYKTASFHHLWVISEEHGRVHTLTENLSKINHNEVFNGAYCATVCNYKTTSQGVNSHIGQNATCTNDVKLSLPVLPSPPAFLRNQSNVSAHSGAFLQL